MKWSAEAREKVATMLREKKTAKEIGDFFNVTRSAITGLIARDIGLCAIEDRRRGKSTAGGKVKRRTAEEIRQWRREYNRAYAAQRREKAKKTGTIIQFPAKTRRSPERPDHKPPQLTVVSNNISLMVEDWLKKHGGPRRFADNDTTNDIYVAEYLKERGVIARRTRMDWGSAGGRWNVSRGAGRPKAASWADILRIADEFRVAEGLPPFKATNEPRNYLRGARA
jgi:hypothetical protein